MYTVGFVAGVQDYISFHSVNRGYRLGLLYVIIFSCLSTVTSTLLKPPPYRLVAFWGVFRFFCLFLDFSLFFPETPIQFNNKYNIETFYVGLRTQTCRNEYMYNHLLRHGILHGKYIEGIDTRGNVLDFRKYIGEFRNAKTPQTTNIILSASLAKSIYDGFLRTKPKDKWFVVLDNDAELDPEFTYKLPEILRENLNFDIIWMYKPLNLGYWLTGNIPCCTVGMVYNRERVLNILEKFNLAFLEENKLINTLNPEPYDILLAKLCNLAYLECLFYPLVSESKHRFPSTHD